jgi:hypothetical protein
MCHAWCYYRAELWSILRRGTTYSRGSCQLQGALRYGHRSTAGSHKFLHVLPSQCVEGALHSRTLNVCRGMKQHLQISPLPTLESSLRSITILQQRKSDTLSCNEHQRRTIRDADFTLNIVCSLRMKDRQNFGD